ncbi:MAG: outer membrane beta-barrel protein [Daejeonella sp.]
MNNTNQNHTDIFFRQGLSSPPEFKPSEQNWRAMERLLKPKAKKRSIGWIYAASGIAAALLVSLVFWLERQKPLATEQKLATKDKDNIIPPATQPAAASKEGIITKKHISPSSNINAFESPSVAANTYPVVESNAGSREPATRPRDLLAAQSVSIRQSLTTGTRAIIAVPANTLSIPEDGKSTESSDLLKDTNTRSSGIPGRWAISLAASPDLNSVAGVDKGAFGMSVGAGVSYRLGKAISIGTGIYYSRKFYSADKTSYRVKEKPFATWTSRSNSIDADCEVIDVPVNLSLKLINKKQNNVYATAGLSSYIMLSEKYNFKYNKSPAYPTGSREYTVRNQNKHVLSVVNLGIAIEKPVNEQVSLVVQPYAKLPLTGIGQGETNLKSFGLALKLNYSFKRK